MRSITRIILRSAVALLAVGFLALLGIVGMTFWLGERAQTYSNDATQARDIRGAAAELRHAVESAESSQRGYVITGNQIYLAPYSTTKGVAERQLGQVKVLSNRYPQTLPAVDRLAKVIGDKFDEMDRIIALKRQHDDDGALAIIRTHRGKALMDEANVFLSGLIRSADARLTKGVGEQQENAHLLRLVTILGAMLIVVVVGMVAFTVGKYTRELALARDEVGLLNAGLEERVKQRTRDLEQANVEIQRFAHVVTHDLRAPLVNIMGFTGELEGSLKSLRALTDRSKLEDATDAVVVEACHATEEDLPEAIGFIRSSTTKMDGLINAILKLSKEGGRRLRPEPVDLTELIDKSTAAIQHQLSHAAGEVSVDLDLPPLLSDRLSLEQVFGNLLDNAVKYRSKSRPLRIAVAGRRIAEDHIEVSIADNGRGIAQSDLGSVFEPFRRAGVQDQPGEGIGLAYVQTLVRNLGGKVGIDSRLDEGTTFRLVLPINVLPTQRKAA